MSQPPPITTPFGYQASPPPRSNIPAIISLVCGILGCVPFVTSAVAVILGLIGLSSAKKPNGSGKGMAIAGLTLGIIGVLGWTGFVGSVYLARERIHQARSAAIAKATADVAARCMATPAGSQATAADKYELLIGEGLQGSGFLVSHRGFLWGVCSLHQFDGETPSELVQLEGDDVQLDPSTVIKQRDVQAMGIAKAPANIPYLAYQSSFTLQNGDEVLIIDAEGDKVTAIITETGLRNGTYDSASGARKLEARTNTPIVAGGASGGPIVLKRTGAVIGVLQTADDPKRATLIGFETLCLPQ